MNVMERRYRRVLRLLPAGYRRSWEEDMVSAFMDSVEGEAVDRPSWRERLSVVGLAARLRLSSAPVSGARRGIFTFALIATISQALAATASLADLGAQLRSSDLIVSSSNLPYLLYWYPVSGPLWIVVFGLLSFGRIDAARVLALMAFLAAAGTTVAIRLVAVPADERANVPWFGIGFVGQYGWLVLSTVCVLLVASRAGVARGLLAAYLAAAAVIAPSAWIGAEPPWPRWPWYVSQGSVTHLVVIVAMVVALALSPARGRWLLPLAAFGGLLAGAALLGQPVYLGAVQRWTDSWMYLPRQDWIDIVQLGLAVVCAVVGLLSLRRRLGGIR